VVGVQYDPVHAVVAAVEQTAVPRAEPVDHPGRFPSAAPPGATNSEQRLGIGLAILGARLLVVVQSFGRPHWGAVLLPAERGHPGTYVATPQLRRIPLPSMHGPAIVVGVESDVALAMAKCRLC
jgi:hypothetical protein